jgi:hypothetical protein
MSKFEMKSAPVKELKSKAQVQSCRIALEVIQKRGFAGFFGGKKTIGKVVIHIFESFYLKKR